MARLSQLVACGVGSDTEAAVRAIRAGAKEFVPLPPNADLIAAVLEAVTEESNALVYCDPAMQKTLHLAEQIAPSNASVLITGESGTGKALLARFLHRKSRRSKKKFVSINCAAIPENLLESELFGMRKGLSPEPSRGASANSRRQARARCCSTKSARWCPICRKNYCGPFRKKRSTASAAANPLR